LAVLEAPGGEVGRGEVGGEETVPAGEADGVGENGARNGVTWAEACAGSGFFGLLGLQANVEFEVVDVFVERLGRFLFGSQWTKVGSRRWCDIRRSLVRGSIP
jgi:hypothetical protein